MSPLDLGTTTLLISPTIALVFVIVLIRFGGKVTSKPIYLAIYPYDTDIDAPFFLQPGEPLAFLLS